MNTINRGFCHLDGAEGRALLLLKKLKKELFMTRCANPCANKRHTTACS